MTSAHDYAQANAGRFREQLHDLLRIPSVSTDPEFATEVQRAADWLAEDMRRIGMNVEIIPTARHPMVYGEWMGAGGGAPTVLIYGHYDVQPAVMEDGWDSDPFEPVERDGKIYARGATDDKGQVFVHVKAVESLLAAEGTMPVNVKLIVEGEEESGSAGITQFVIDHPDKLSADVCLVSDTSILTIDQPSIIYALRGLLAMELYVTGPDHDLHSGTFGGSVHNPVQAAAEIVAKLHDADGRIAVPGFYNDVLSLSDQERAELAKVPWSDADWKAATGAPQSWGEPGFSLRERTGARPTLEINGMAGGYYGAGFKTVLPAKAMVKISCRLVANQDPQHIYEQIRDYVQTITPPTVKAELKLLGKGPGAFVDITTPAMQAAMKAYEQGWGKPPVFMREGGSIPIVAEFQNRLGAPVILMGFGLATDNLHGPNEHFTIELFHKGIDTSIYFLKAVAGLKNQQ